MENNTTNNDIPSESVTKRKLTSKTTQKPLDMQDLKRLVELKYEHYSYFGRKLGWTGTTVGVFLNGFWIPSDPEVIRKIATELDINVVKLTQLFGRTEEKGKITTADKLEEKE